MKVKESRKAERFIESVVEVRFYCAGCGQGFTSLKGKTARTFARDPQLIHLKEHGLQHAHSLHCDIALINHEIVTK